MSSERDENLVILIAWLDMRLKCEDRAYPLWWKHGKEYRSVCREWNRLNFFPNFVQYVRENLGTRPEGYVFEIIDNTRNFEPGNIRWEKLDPNPNPPSIPITRPLLYIVKPTEGRVTDKWTIQVKGFYLGGYKTEAVAMRVRTAFCRHLERIIVLPDAA